MRWYFLVVNSLLEFSLASEIDSQVDVVLRAAPYRNHSHIFIAWCHLDRLQSDGHEKFFCVLPGYQGPHACLDPTAAANSPAGFIFSTFQHSVLIVI